MFVFHSILNDKKTQSNHLFIGKNHQLAFMLVEMIFGVLIFVATLSIAYKYLGLIRSLVKKVGEYNQVIDEVSSALEMGPQYKQNNVTWKTYSYTPKLQSSINTQSYYVPTVTIGIVKAQVGEGSDAQTVTLQTAYR